MVLLDAVGGPAAEGAADLLVTEAGSRSSGGLDGLEDDAGHDRRLGAEGQVRGVDVGDVGAGAAGPSHRDGLGLIGPRSSSATAPSTKAPPANAPAQSAS